MKSRPQLVTEEHDDKATLLEGKGKRASYPEKES